MVLSKILNYYRPAFCGTLGVATDLVASTNVACMEDRTHYCNPCSKLDLVPNYDGIHSHNQGVLQVDWRTMKLAITTPEETWPQGEDPPESPYNKSGVKPRLSGGDISRFFCNQPWQRRLVVLNIDMLIRRGYRFRLNTSMAAEALSRQFAAVNVLSGTRLLRYRKIGLTISRAVLLIASSAPYFLSGRKSTLFSRSTLADSATVLRVSFGPSLKRWSDLCGYRPTGLISSANRKQHGDAS